MKSKENNSIYQKALDKIKHDKKYKPKGCSIIIPNETTKRQDFLHMEEGLVILIK